MKSTVRLLVELPYEQRRILVVQESDPADQPPPTGALGELQRLAESAVREVKASPLGGVAGWAGLALASVGAAPLIVGAAGVGLIAALGGGTAALMTLVGRVPGSSAAGLGLMRVSAAVARREFKFPPGHPAIGRVYVGHPLVPARYLPIESFHPNLFEAKVNDLVSLLAALGATRVRVVHRTGYRQSGGGEFSASAGGTSVGAKASGHAERNAEVMFEEHYPPPKGSPRIPDDLVWYGHEESWQRLAERRLQHDTKRFRATLNYSESFGIDASVKASVEGVGLKVGGNFKDFEETSWEFEGEFA